MHIAILGDVHGCVRHASTVATDLGVDAALQVGDLGAYPTYAALPPEDRAFVDAHPEQGDIFGLLSGEVELPGTPPIYFVTGNHDSPDWLASLHTPAQPLTPIDPCGAFWHAADGSAIELGGRRVGFLGGIEEPETGHDIDLEKAAGWDHIDILVTHDGPYGLASWRGRTQGSRKLLHLIEHLQPTVHVHGHYHHRNGPRRYGRTSSFALAQLVPPRRHLNRPDLAEGGVGLLNTDAMTFDYLPAGSVYP